MKECVNTPCFKIPKVMFRLDKSSSRDLLELIQLDPRTDFLTRIDASTSRKGTVKAATCSRCAVGNNGAAMTSAFWRRKRYKLNHVNVK